MVTAQQAPQVAKLGHMLTDDELAALLVDGGLPLPANIKAATDEDVIAAVGSENLAAVRVRFPEIEQ